MSYTPTTVVRYLTGPSWDSVRGEILQFCQELLQHGAVLPLSETLRIVESNHCQNRDVGGIVAIGSLTYAQFNSPTFRRFGWRMELRSDAPLQLDIVPNLGKFPHVLVKYDSSDPTAATSAETEFESMARRLVETRDNCLLITVQGIYGSPAAIYFHLVHALGFIPAIGPLPISFVEFQKRISTDIPSLPDRLMLVPSKTKRWLSEIGAQLNKEHHGT